MGCPVILTEKSLRDLAQIVAFIARDNQERAEAFGYELINRALRVGDFPEQGRQVPEFGNPTVREIMHGSYRIIYRLTHNPTGIFVLRFWHAARGTPQIPRGEL
jgi:toxin ParE1/3/4